MISRRKRAVPRASDAAGTPKPAGHTRLISLAAWRGVGELYDSDGLTHAASIAYYTLLSFFPMMLLGVFILGEMTNDATDRDAVVRFVFRYFPQQFGFISGQIEAFQTQPVTFGFWGVVGLIWASLGVFNAITSVFEFIKATSFMFCIASIFSFVADILITITGVFPSISPILFPV